MPSPVAGTRHFIVQPADMGHGDTPQLTAQRLQAALDSDDDPDSLEDRGSEVVRSHAERRSTPHPYRWLLALAAAGLVLAAAGVAIAFLMDWYTTRPPSTLAAPQLVPQKLTATSSGKSDSESPRHDVGSVVVKNSENSFQATTGQTSTGTPDNQSEAANIFGAKFVAADARFPGNWKTLLFSFDGIGAISSFPIGGNQMVSGTLVSSYVSADGAICRQADIELVGKQIKRPILGCRTASQSWDQATILVLSK